LASVNDPIEPFGSLVSQGYLWLTLRLQKANRGTHNTRYQLNAKGLSSRDCRRYFCVSLLEQLISVCLF